MTFNSIAHQLGISQSTSNKNGNAQDLRILQTAGNEHVAIPASSKNWNSSLTLEERNQYELMINLKSSFAVSLEFLPKTFEPESAQYLIDVGKISFGFGIIAGFVLLLVFFYLMLRFCCKKCIGPVKTSQVSKKYKKITWVLLIISIVLLCLISILILFYSVKINLAAREVFKDVEIQANNIQNNNLVHIKQLVSDLQVQGNYTVSSTNLEKLDKGIKEFANNTIYRVKVTIDWENGRALVTLILLGIYCFLVLLSLVAFCKTWQRVILVNSLLLLFTLPLILFFQGLNASYYFVYSDVCHSVNDAIYGNAFPIANKGLGYYINCFDKDTKGSLYYLNYELSRISSDIDQKISSDNTSEEDLTKLKLLKEELLIIGMKYLKPMLSCAHVYTSVQDVEKTICTNGMNWSYQLLMSYSWLFLIILLTGISTNKLSSIAWRRRVEMEAMLALEEQTE